MLVCLLEVLQALSVPVVLVFDQIEDFIADVNEDRERERTQAFGRALAALVNAVPGLCLLVFAEELRWDAMLLNLDGYARARIDQDFTLPGRPSRRAICMPDAIRGDLLERVVERRVRFALGGDFDPTGLPRIFPFSGEQMSLALEETTIRGCLARLCDWFNGQVFGPPPTPPVRTEGAGPLPPPPPPVPALGDRLRSRWDAEVSGARGLIQGDAPRPSLIPHVQAALESWLSFLRDHHIGGAEAWAKVELLQATDLGPYGYLTVIRTDGPDSPGLGLAAWLAQKRGRPLDLENRLSFFSQKPCPVRTLVLFRADGEGALDRKSVV